MVWDLTRDPGTTGTLTLDLAGPLTISPPPFPLRTPFIPFDLWIPGGVSG
jgi:hypothetical protein